MKIILIPGSLRKNSYNKMALNFIKKEIEETGNKAEIIDLKKVNMPLFDEDIESAGVPQNIIDFQNKLLESDAFIIAVPEYNHSVSGALKNAIDWASRSKSPVFKNKSIGLTGASTGMGGTIRAQIAILPTLRALGGNIIPYQSYIAAAQNVFSEDGNINDDSIRNNLRNLVLNVIGQSKK
ncbi:MAG: NAD(P)H-dependent oxidoreductase [Ignavibacteria bacterium]|nr:NAD(P)H-dependent oxidoreductase [Ignavibacteria bacterium]